MLSDRTIRIIIVGAFLAHGVAHAIALAALAAQGVSGEAGSRVTVRSWLFPSLESKAVAVIAVPFWALATAGFALAAMSFWGILIPAGAGRGLAVAGAVVSLVAIGLFSAIWPGSPNRARSILNTGVALMANLTILVGLLGLHWPPRDMFGG